MLQKNPNRRVQNYLFVCVLLLLLLLQRCHKKIRSRKMSKNSVTAVFLSHCLLFSCQCVSMLMLLLLLMLMLLLLLMMMLLLLQRCHKKMRSKNSVCLLLQCLKSCNPSSGHALTIQLSILILRCRAFLYCNAISFWFI